MKFAQPIIGIFSGIGKLLGSLVGGAVGFFIDFLVKGFGLIYDVISFIGESINTYIVEPIMTAVNAISNGFSSIGSFLGISDEEGRGKTSEQVAATNSSFGSPTDAINDGVVQNGNVVSTHPEDFLIATKTPGALANSVGGGTAVQSSPTIDISALVSKMDEMIQAVSANRDVYMDREKVSSAVVTSSEKSSQNRFGLMGA